MKRKLQPLPDWLTTSLQGLAFWISYKRALYRDYPLSEGALVTELRTLIHANLSDEHFLKCEVAYSKLVTKGTIRPKIIAGRVRVDLVIATASESKKIPGKLIYSPHVVMEFKLAKAPAPLLPRISSAWPHFNPFVPPLEHSCWFCRRPAAMIDLLPKRVYRKKVNNQYPHPVVRSESGEHSRRPLRTPTRNQPTMQALLRYSAM